MQRTVITETISSTLVRFYLQSCIIILFQSGDLKLLLKTFYYTLTKKVTMCLSYQGYGEQLYYCPACVLPDDGSPMIGCEGGCDEWYHW